MQSRLDGPIRYKIGTMVAEPNKVAGQVEGFAKTVEGATYNNQYHVYFELEGDKIVGAREYNDTAHHALFEGWKMEPFVAGSLDSIADIMEWVKASDLSDWNVPDPVAQAGTVKQFGR